MTPVRDPHQASANEANEATRCHPLRGGPNEVQRGATLFVVGQNLKIRADLMIELARLIEARDLTQAAAADLLGVTQPRISDLVRGKIDRLSVDTLITMLGHAGASVSVKVSLGRQVA